MKRNNALFLTLTGASVVLMAAIMTDNIMSMPGISTSPPVIQTPADQDTARETEATRQKFIKMGLPLHEGNYWKTTN